MAAPASFCLYTERGLLTFLVMHCLRRALTVGLHLLVLLFAFRGTAQPLPKIELRPAFPELLLHRPIWMQEATDDSRRFFIAEQVGRVVTVTKGSDGKESKEFLSITDRGTFVENSNEEGLLGFALHPQFRANGKFYIYYTQQNPRRSVISEFKTAEADPSKADLSTERILFEVMQPYANHNGGELCFGPDGFLYIGLGDGGSANDPMNNAQNSASLLGKILRIDVNTTSTIARGRGQTVRPYGIPMDNPLTGETDRYGVRKEIWALGVRNPWRFSWDRETGVMWEGDVGQNEWEEVNIIVKGGNYGWNVREALHHFKPGPEGAKYFDPIIEYPHTANLLAQGKFPEHSIGSSITGGYVYRGKQYPALRGVYLYADFTLGTIWGLRYQEGKLLEHGTLVSQPKNVASFAEDLDGELYVLASDGRVYSVSVP